MATSVSRKFIRRYSLETGALLRRNFIQRKIRIFRRKKNEIISVLDEGCTPSKGAFYTRDVAGDTDSEDCRVDTSGTYWCCLEVLIVRISRSNVEGQRKNRRREGAKWPAKGGAGKR